MAMQPTSPKISVITATYNRSNVLKYAIASVINSTFNDWELLVVGDACTDDTEEVVASFNDPRIRFTNLSQNVGDQSGPHNEGFRLSRGHYIAYLNHDDLYLPDHLNTALRGIERAGSDLVFTLGISPGATPQFVLLGATPTHVYDQSTFVPASLWLLKRELLEEIGPWRNYRECYTTPSQDLLLRAWRAGKDIRLIPAMTVIAIQAGLRPNVYAKREFEENKEYFERICNEPDFRERELLAAYLGSAAAYNKLDIWVHIRRAIINIIKRTGLKFRLTPIELVSYIRARRKGGIIYKLREKEGLSKFKQ